MMRWVAEVGAATGRTVAYAGGLAEISAKIPTTVISVATQTQPHVPAGDSRGDWQSK